MSNYGLTYFHLLVLNTAGLCKYPQETQTQTRPLLFGKRNKIFFFYHVWILPVFSVWIKINTNPNWGRSLTPSVPWWQCYRTFRIVDRTIQGAEFVPLFTNMSSGCSGRCAYFIGGFTAEGCWCFPLVFLKWAIFSCCCLGPTLLKRNWE